jgi:type VI secretion system secreted protein Hcp
MAVDAILKISGIAGESKIDSHEDEIDIYSWSWGMSQSGTFHTGRGGAAGRVNVSDLTVTKYVDASTPLLMRHCCSGAHIPEATLYCRKMGTDALDYMVITLKRIMVTSVSPGGASGEELVTENISFNFAEFHIQYTSQNDDGSPGAQFDLGWNIETNRTA